MDRELIIQKLRQAASSGYLSDNLCKTLDEAAEILEGNNEKAEADVEGGGNSWWYVCSECRTVTNRGKKYCHECGRRLIWK